MVLRNASVAVLFKKKMGGGVEDRESAMGDLKTPKLSAVHSFLKYSVYFHVASLNAVLVLK